MGAKTPEQIKKSNKARPPVKCDICGRQFLNVAALKSHHKFLHLKQEPSKPVVKKPENVKPGKKKMVPLHLLKRVDPSESKQTRKSTETVKPDEIAAKSPSSTRKAEFECPICAAKFPVYFTAFRHIQKNHCVDSSGEEVPPNSPHLVKPIRIETCASCQQQIRSTIPHDCPKMQGYKDQYLCLGCDQMFNGLLLFQHHVKGMHADGALNYFFSNKSEFESWKAELQEVIVTDFTKLNKQKNKEIYHCSFQPSDITSTSKLCPATIIVREYLRGVHVCYYKEHFGHTIEEDIEIPLKDYQQYSISLYTKECEDLKLEAEQNNELHTQFKNMLQCIIAEAANIDSGTLNDLFGRALEMTTILKKYHREHNTPLVGKSLSDNQISQSLDSLKPKKRKPNTEESKNVVAKKIKKTAVENGVSTRVSRSSTALNKSVSFNKSGPKKVETDKETEIPEKDIVETPQKSKKKEEQPLKSALKKTEPTIPETTDVQKPEPPPPVRSQIQSPSSFNDSYKNFVDQNFKCVTESSTPKAKIPVKKKEVVKTKIGQFKPTSPRHVSPKNVSPKSKDKEVPLTPIFRVKPDVEYIVKEQENDCNILILKI